MMKKLQKKYERKLFELQKDLNYRQTSTDLCLKADRNPLNLDNITMTKYHRGAAQHGAKRRETTTMMIQHDDCALVKLLKIKRRGDARRNDVQPYPCKIKIKTKSVIVSNTGMPMDLEWPPSPDPFLDSDISDLGLPTRTVIIEETTERVTFPGMEEQGGPFLAIGLPKEEQGGAAVPPMAVVKDGQGAAVPP